MKGKSNMITAKKGGRFLALVSAAVISVGSAFACMDDLTAYAAMNSSEFSSGYSYPTQMRGLNAFQIVSDMGAGWNLGNSLESSDSETNWGNPATTKAMIDAVAAKGFTTLRVPVRWDDHYSDPSSYTISSDFMDRVETVVNYGLANGMYVILNIHHNDIQTQVSASSSVQAKVTDELKAVWTQVGQRFKNYGDKLIFETINEPRYDEDWTGNTTFYQCVNVYNEAARSAIRATGGNNAKRLVMMPTYCASGDSDKINGWANSSGDSMVAVSIHAYLPFDFAFEGSGHNNWLTSDKTELDAFFSRINSTFISKGIPVVIGEFGACNKNNTDARENYADIYVSLARQFAEQDIPCVWWDNNCFGTGAENFGIFSRASKSFTYGGIADGIINAYKGDPAYETSTTGENILFSGSASSSNYGQAVSFSAESITELSSSDKIYCSYSSNNLPEFILQSFTDSSKSWVKVAPDSASNGTAVWSVSNLVKAFGGSFNSLGKAYIGDTGASLTVTKVYVPGGMAHTHVYNGTASTALEATAYTDGRQIIRCSVSGCDSYRIKIIPKGSQSAVAGPKITKAVPGDGQVALNWTEVSDAQKYAVYYRYAGAWKNAGTTTALGKYVRGLTNGTSYGFAVKAYVNGAWTDVTSADIVYATPSVPVVKPKITKAAPGDGQIGLNWTATPGASQYAVYYRYAGAWIKAGTTTALGKYVRGLTNGTSYGFAVKAYVNGAWTDVTSADIVYAVPGAVTENAAAVNYIDSDADIDISDSIDIFYKDFN